MSDTHQAIYDAVRSKISGGDISSVVRDVLWQQMDISHLKAMIQGDAAVIDVLAERIRQVEAEGWTSEHDDQHSRGEMASAAGVYALAAGSTDYRWVLRGSPPNDYLAAALELWPWDRSWFKPKDRRRDLVKAGALILAEIERLDRLSEKEPTS